MTPFGIARLDLLPAHAVPATRGTWAVEANVSYQDTDMVSDNVSDYLKSRGDGRIPSRGRILTPSWPCRETPITWTASSANRNLVQRNSFRDLQDRGHLVRHRLYASRSVVQNTTSRS